MAQPISDPLIDLLDGLPPAPAPTPTPADDTFEVHYWPHTGRVMTVHLNADTGAWITDLRVVGTGGRGTDHLTCMTGNLAEHLADRSNPQAALAEHTPDSRVTYLWPQPAADPQDRTFHLEAAGITLPAPTYTVTDHRPLPGGRRATLLRRGTPVGVITQTGDRPTLAPVDGALPRTLADELAEFARSCHDRDGLPVTLSRLLAALLTEYDTPPAGSTGPAPGARR